jgi:hypothetical protein
VIGWGDFREIADTGDTAKPRLILAAITGAGVLVAIASASVRLSPRDECAFRRPHAVVAASTVVLLCSAGFLTQAVIEHFKNVARGV